MPTREVSQMSNFGPVLPGMVRQYSMEQIAISPNMKSGASGTGEIFGSGSSFEPNSGFESFKSNGRRKSLRIQKQASNLSTRTLEEVDPVLDESVINRRKAKAEQK